MKTVQASKIVQFDILTNGIKSKVKPKQWKSEWSSRLKLADYAGVACFIYPLAGWGPDYVYRYL